MLYSYPNQNLFTHTRKDKEMDEKTNTPDCLMLTEDKVRDYARAYVPMVEKRKFVDDVCAYCFDKLNVSAGDGDDGIMPPLYKENLGRKQKYLAAALVKLYMGENFAPASEDDEWSISDETYDYICSGRPLSQIERIRRNTKDKELQAKCYDLVQDFKDLRDMLNSECHGLLHAMNDTLTRFKMLMEAQTTPEYFQQLTKGLEDAQAELVAYAEQRKKGLPE